MAFKRVSVRHRFQLLSCLHGRHQHLCHHRVAINVQRVRISFKCRTSNRRVQRVSHHRQWLSVHSLAWAPSQPDGVDRFAADRVRNYRPMTRRNGPRRMIVRVNYSRTPNICICILLYHFRHMCVFFLLADKDKEGKESKQSNQLAMPRLSVCADAQKVDRAKLAQTEFSIIEFDPDTFRVLLDYLHTGSCPLTCVTIPGTISPQNS